MITLSQKYLYCILICLLAALLVFPWQLDRPFYTRGEPREALVAQAMVKSGNWILPSVYDGAVPSKPPLTHWVMGAISLLRGEVTEATARAPSALAFILFAIAFFLFLEKRVGGPKALLSSVILITSVEWLRAGLTTRVDMALASLMVGGLLSLYAWKEKELKGVPYLAIALLACATLTKGPVGIVLPLLAFCLYLLLTGCALRKILVTGLLVFVPVTVVALIWYKSAYVVGGDAFLDKVLYENVARFMSSTRDMPHKHSALYLYATLLIGFMPWVFLVIPGLIVQGVQGGMSGLMLKNIKAYVRSAPPLFLFALVVVTVTLTFYTVPSSKRGEYLLPVYPFLAFIVADFIMAAQGQVAKVIKVSLSVFAALVLVLVGLACVLHYEWVDLASLLSKPRQIAAYEFYLNCLRDLVGGAMWPTILLFVAALAYLFAAILIPIRVERRGALAVLGVGAFYSICLLISTSGLPTVASNFTSRKFAREVQSLVSREEVLYSFGDAMYGLSFYLEKNFISTDKQLPGRGFVFSYDKNLERIEEVLQPNQRLHVLRRSSTAVRKPHYRLVLVEITTVDTVT
ncbi:glycosyltransferase family 39 protein [Oligoflexia bacterium]|nr:glycosyltransferase family 39 protein [Oligoflexia bacterium]